MAVSCGGSGGYREEMFVVVFIPHEIVKASIQCSNPGRATRMSVISGEQNGLVTSVGRTTANESGRVLSNLSISIPYLYVSMSVFCTLKTFTSVHDFR